MQLKRMASKVPLYVLGRISNITETLIIIILAENIVVILKQMPYRSILQKLQAPPEAPAPPICSFNTSQLPTWKHGQLAIVCVYLSCF